MLRRNFVKSLFGAGTAAMVAKPAVAGNSMYEVLTKGQWIRYKGCHLWWTGWKGAMGNDSIASQWIAYEYGLNKMPVVVGVPGAIHLDVPRYYCFDLTPREGQVPLTYSDLAKRPEFCERMKRESFDEFIRLVDEYSRGLRRGNGGAPHEV